MRTNAIVFDLDDTLIDTKKRHYNIVNDFLHSYGKSLDFGHYLDIRKSAGLSNKQIIRQYYSLDENEFSMFWRLNIENPDYFKYDVELVDRTLLEKFKAKHAGDFVLLSLRSNAASAVKQFLSFSFSAVIDEYDFLRHADINPKIEKLQHYKRLYRHVLFISDSQDDCSAAAKAGVDFVGVESGIYPICCDRRFSDINSFLLKQSYDQ